MPELTGDGGQVGKREELSLNGIKRRRRRTRKGTGGGAGVSVLCNSSSISMMASSHPDSLSSSVQITPFTPAHIFCLAHKKQRQVQGFCPQGSVQL